MPLKKEEVIVVKEVEGTPGGTTYHIIKKDDPDQRVRTLCFRLSKDIEHPGERCARPAGNNTDHLGTGACHLHGGNSGVSTMITGAASIMTKGRLADKIQVYLNDDAEKQYDLTKELASMRGTLDQFLENMADPEATDPKEKAKYGNDIIRLSMLVGTIGTLVEKISKINSRNTLTAAQALYIKAIVADILMKYLKDPDQRERAVKELISRFGGGSAPVTLGMINRYEEVKEG